MQTKTTLNTKNLPETNLQIPTHLTTNNNLHTCSNPFEIENKGPETMVYHTSLVINEFVINFENYTKLTELQRTFA